MPDTESFTLEIDPPDNDVPPDGVADYDDVCVSVFDPTRGKPALPHGGTFNANPVTMVAGLASMRLLTAQAFGELAALGDHAREECRRAFRLAEVEGQVTGAGSLLMLHLNERMLRTYRDAHRPPEESERFGKLFHALMDHGIIMSPSGLLALSTPMGEAEVEHLFNGLLGSLKQVRDGERTAG